MAKKSTYTVADYCEVLQHYAPLSLQENYDNSGLIIGTKTAIVTNVLLTLDCTEAVLQEAIDKNCQLIIAHHPIIFSGLKKINQTHYVQRIVTTAIKNDVAIYACHTNLDNAFLGVNYKIAQTLGLQNISILSPKPHQLIKLYTYVPQPYLAKVHDALFSAGAGHIGNYKDCSFCTTGLGTYTPTQNAKPFKGKRNERTTAEEIKLEVLLTAHQQSNVLAALKKSHPYEEVAYELVLLENSQQEIGSGVIAEMPKSMSQKQLLLLLKLEMKANGIRFTTSKNKKFKKIALCGGSGSFLIKSAIAQGADAFITADVKYHDFFEADNRIAIIDIGHYESEHHTPQLFYDILSKKFPTFALHLSKINTNPIKYF